MDLQLSGKRALITGSTSGIGEAIAKALAAERAAVIVHGRNEAEAERVADAIRTNGGTVAIVLGDLSGPVAAQSVAANALAAFGGSIDILVNNAGALESKPWFASTPADWIDSYARNIGPMVQLILACVPGMKQQGWGRVIAISSGLASSPQTATAAYAATKAAELNLSVSLAKELARTGVTSNAVSPGTIWTKGLERDFRGIALELGWPDDASQWPALFGAEQSPFAVPSGRVGWPADVADLVAFVASPRSGYINGANLRVDGGYVPTVN